LQKAAIEGNAMVYQRIGGGKKGPYAGRWIFQILMGIAAAAAVVLIIGFALFIAIPLIVLVLIAFLVYYLIRRHRSLKKGSRPAGAREILVNSNQYYTDEEDDDRENG
jgi:quinol-cytochrome oxidoreductase complex cytochrome b subunit